MKNDREEIIDLDDYDFSFTSKESMIELQSTPVTNFVDDVDDLKDRLLQLREMFLPLLENLNKNSDTEMIKWPNRKHIIDQQIDKLKSLTNI